MLSYLVFSERLGPHVGSSSSGVFASGIRSGARSSLPCSLVALGTLMPKRKGQSSHRVELQPSQGQYLTALLVPEQSRHFARIAFIGNNTFAISGSFPLRAGAPAVMLRMVAPARLIDPRLREGW